jgi:predicted nucleic-acid-binding Zn-ribbon protein
MTTKPFEIKDDAYTCIKCGMISYNPRDIENRYCGNCKQFEDVMLFDMTCPRCRLNSSKRKQQIYMVSGELGEYIFDVAKARRILREKPHPIFHVMPDLIEKMLVVNVEHTPEHIDHVNPHNPGIIAQRLGGWALIDGNHRARRCLRDAKPFYVQALDFEESNQCMLAQPVSFTPELVARELAGILKNNHNVGLLSVTLQFTEGESPVDGEKAIRSHLTSEDNARLEILFEPQKKSVQNSWIKLGR